MNRRHLKSPPVVALALALLVATLLASAGSRARADTGARARADVQTLQVRNELGIVYAKNGNLEDALRQFSLILAKDGASAAALNNTANVYFLQGDTDRARDLYGRALTAAPDEGGIRLNYGVLLHMRGEEEESLRQIRKGILLVGDVAQAYYLLGFSRQPSGRAGAGDGGRASDESGLREVEIGDLLRRALASVPEADSTQVKLASPKTGVDTRAGGAKAARVGTDDAVSGDRLFWMDVAERP